MNEAEKQRSQKAIKNPGAAMEFSLNPVFNMDRPPQIKVQTQRMDFEELRLTFTAYHIGKMSRAELVEAIKEWKIGTEGEKNEC